ncbi:terminase large subunit domain-containing protein [Actomonas aquatica]|uniref:Terminase n=1 Tax=Actomonas aquatica TaxID=2866162 RepID=A0ABZ1CCK1_9BACT|nr:terminase family protein [Opitutus sp. WL0086]WRQ89398.1 hypothetical protein K1X11_008250 [Opitutus sp. WL0086]
MTNVLPSKIDSEQEASRYFLPYQLDHIGHEERLSVWEKSFRIGATWADAFRNVRKRLRFKKRDYLFATRDYPSAIEYMEQARQFCEIYNHTKSIVNHGEEEWKVPVRKSDGTPAGFTETIKVSFIKFDNGSRIIAFSSNPNAMLVYGGDVGLDEFPRHQRAEELYQVAQARVTWGYDLDMWGSHFGNDTLFYQIAQDGRAGRGGWRHRMVTIVDAVNQGLVEKINATRGTNFTREGFIADCRKRARDEATYEEAYMCNPRGGTAVIVPWSQIELCMGAYEAERLHLEATQISEMFGDYSTATEQDRARQIRSFLDATFPELFTRDAHHHLGYDVAASGRGDLAAIYVDEKAGDTQTLRGLMTWRTDDWNFHDVVTHHFMKRVCAVRGAGDETGLGRKICWELAKKFPGRFQQVNFASSKHDMGFSLMNQLSTAQKRFPREWQDVALDFFALRKTHNGKKWLFSEGTNNMLSYSHCDIAWGGGLSTEASKSTGYQGKTEDFQAWGKPRGAGRDRSNFSMEG